MENLHFPKELDIGFQEIEIPFISQEDEVAVLVNQVTVNNKRYKIVIATPIEKIDDTIEIFIGWLLFAGLLLYVIALILGYRVITRVLSPVRTITQTAQTISKSNLSKRVPLPDREDEFYQLAKTFNTMLERLEKNFDKINRFNVNVSHELKTPLTIIRGEIEVALLKDRSIKEYKTVLQTILEETKTIQSIIETLLLLSKSDTKALKKRMLPLSLDTLILEAVEEKRQNANEQSINIVIKELESVTIVGEPTLLKRAIANIIDNAIKYSPPNTNIEITLNNSSDTILMIKDSGYGIPYDHIDKIFDPFFRIESTNEKRVQGQGLGLSIVQWIVKLHNAKINIESEVAKGTIFKIYFNKNN
ncbi:sensor histidine kinase [Hydrogenimonas thermophila]|nr:ATP-binding protein [Hydrogenimonas thermophila]